MLLCLWRQCSYVCGDSCSYVCGDSAAMFEEIVAAMFEEVVAATFVDIVAVICWEPFRLSVETVASMSREILKKIPVSGISTDMVAGGFTISFALSFKASFATILRFLGRPTRATGHGGLHVT